MSATAGVGGTLSWIGMILTRGIAASAGQSIKNGGLRSGWIVRLRRLIVAKMRKVKSVGKATFTRTMYPDVKFCELCFCHHNQAECPFPMAEFKPTIVELEDMPGYRAKESA